MVANTIFPLVLALGGPNNIQRVEVNESSAATSVLAYDDTGEVAAEIIVRRTGDGEVMLSRLRGRQLLDGWAVVVCRIDFLRRLRMHRMGVEG